MTQPPESLPGGPAYEHLQSELFEAARTARTGIAFSGSQGWGEHFAYWQIAPGARDTVWRDPYYRHGDTRETITEHRSDGVSVAVTYLSGMKVSPQNESVAGIRVYRNGTTEVLQGTFTIGEDDRDKTQWVTVDPNNTEQVNELLTSAPYQRLLNLNEEILRAYTSSGVSRFSEANTDMGIEGGDVIARLLRTILRGLRPW